MKRACSFRNAWSFVVAAVMGIEKETISDSSECRKISFGKYVHVALSRLAGLSILLF